MDAQPEVAPYEREVALDLARRGAIIAPGVVLVAGLVRGWAGVVAAAIAIAVVCANFLASALIIGRLSRLGGSAMAAGVLIGWIVRMALIVAVLAVCRHASAVDFPVLGITILATHLGLLFWEAKYVSLSLAAPGLRPRGPVTHGDQ